MKGTNIQWADDTVNPTSGCDGCELWIPSHGGPCYAGNFHETRLATSLPALYDPVFTNVRLIPGRMAKAVRCVDMTGRHRAEKPWLNGLRRKIFVGDLGDIFSAAVPFDFLKAEIIDIALGTGQRHDLLLLTKQPQRAVKFASWLSQQGIQWPDNVWIGTSITNKLSLGRIRHLAAIPAKHRFLSLEPLVSDPCLDASHIADIVDWIIIGGESDQGSTMARPFYLRWAADVIALGQKLNTAVFVKQLGSRPMDCYRGFVSLADRHGGDWDEWDRRGYGHLRVRQMPFGCL